MTNLILQRDRLKFKELALRILPRKGTGCLAFVTCDRGELQAEILTGLRAQLSPAFSMVEHAIRPNQPYLSVLPAYEPGSPELHVYTGYPYDRLILEDPALVQENRKLAETLNIERTFMTLHHLHLIWILPQQVEDTLALLAPDFYLFRTHSIHFSADLLPALPKRHDWATMERRWLLEKQLHQSRDFLHKGNVHMDLALWNMSVNELDVAEKHLNAAIKFYQKKKSKGDLFAAYGRLGLVLMRQHMNRQGELLFHKALRLGASDRHQVFIVYLNIVNCLLNACDCDGAEVWLNKIVLPEIDEPVLRLSFYANQAFLCCSRGDTASGLELLRLLRAWNTPFDAGISGIAIKFYLQVGESDEGICKIYFEEIKKWKYLFAGEWARAIECVLVAERDLETQYLRAYLLYQKQAYASACHVAEQGLALLSTVEAELSKREFKALLLKIERHTKPAAEVEAECLSCLAEWGNIPAHECTLLRIVLGFIYCDTDRPAQAWDMVQQATAVAEPANYRFLLGEIAMLSAKLLGKEGKGQEAYDVLKQGYEHVRDRHVAMAAECLELIGQAAEQCGDPRARGWYQKALTLYEMLELKQAAAVAEALERLGAAQ